MTRYDGKAYKAEFFDRALNFTFFTVIDEPEIVFDYLTLDKTSIVIPCIADISRGWYCHITRDADVVYQGFVSGVDTGESTTTVQLSPLIALFDFQFFYNRKTYNNNKSDLEGWMRSRLLNAFAGSDSVQNIHGLTVTAATHTDGVDLHLKDNIHDFWDLARTAIQFLLTHPVRGATGLAGFKALSLLISTHAPRERCDRCREINPQTRR